MHKVLMYTTPTCGFCKMAKAFFKENNVAFEEKDVTVDMEAQKAMIAQTNQMGVPVIDVDGTAVIGFDKPRLMELLDIKE